jgi:vacuolar protein sorting-associated protein 45
MDLLKTSHSYVNRMVGAQSSQLAAASSKIKVLLLDQETTAIISLCTTQSLLLKHDIYLIE